MQVDLGQSWRTALGDYLQNPQFHTITSFAERQYELQKTIYPKPENVFASFRTTPFDDVKVVILGQDPYHGPRQAMGLSFSVPSNIKNPPSLQNIFKELAAELGEKSQAETVYGGDLSSWAEQGVLLLNAVLTVEHGKPGSHAGKGWEDFTNHVIKTISDKKQHVVFFLWGKYAAQKTALIDSSKHLILTAPHPSPLSAHRGFYGCNHFKKTNEYLEQHGRRSINW